LPTTYEQIPLKNVVAEKNKNFSQAKVVKSIPKKSPNKIVQKKKQVKSTFGIRFPIPLK
jgi:hypothetical protein